MRDAMEKNYPYRNSDTAPPSAAPPSNRSDQAFASTGTAGQGSIALDTMRSNGGAPYITAQGGLNGDVESQKRPELIFSIDREEGGDIAGSTVEEERRKKDAAALLARTKSPVQRVRTPAGNKRDNDNA